MRCESSNQSSVLFSQKTYDISVLLRNTPPKIQHYFKMGFFLSGMTGELILHFKSLMPFHSTWFIWTPGMRLIKFLKQTQCKLQTHPMYSNDVAYCIVNHPGFWKSSRLHNFRTIVVKVLCRFLRSLCGRGLESFVKRYPFEFGWTLKKKLFCPGKNFFQITLEKKLFCHQKKIIPQSKRGRGFHLGPWRKN